MEVIDEQIQTPINWYFTSAPAITIVYRTSSERFDVSNFYSLDNWMFLLTMGWGTFTMLYAIRLGCSNCGARQVVPGLSIFSLRWPQDKCCKCGVEIK
ncbi:hypothetical protein [Shewanella sp. GutDb-MelDb]|uniref:hypothetical protein n=1 Tax=Shewanella sp. GutDb-MelDb TaxID=2058316 RepID=UPI000C7B10B1|nr:hypothetical protein [Shewanella sp. GutDb-MelDb]PKG56117.1 hypothetical protein CXF82_16540 [Shewanella sp. GutDb-MelDb]